MKEAEENSTSLLQLSEQIRTQDNRITAHPIFIVQQVRRSYVPPGWTDSEVWYSPESDREADAYTAAVLNSCKWLVKYQADEIADFWGVSLDGWQCVGVEETWEFVQPFFSERGANEYIATNKHNLRHPRVYVDSGHRNEEWQLMRAFLLSLTPEPTSH